MSFNLNTLVNTDTVNTKSIQDISIGDMILAYDETNQNHSIVPVVALSSIIQDHITCITFNDGSTLYLSNEHQLLTQAGWKAIDPSLTLPEHPTARSDYSTPASGAKTLMSLQVGDSFLSLAGTTKTISSIQTTPGDTQTFNVMQLSGQHIYYCNGIPVMSWSTNFSEPFYTTF